MNYRDLRSKILETVGDEFQTIDFQQAAGNNFQHRLTIISTPEIIERVKQVILSYERAEYELLTGRKGQGKKALYSQKPNVRKF